MAYSIAVNVYIILSLIITICLIEQSLSLDTYSTSLSIKVALNPYVVLDHQP